MDAKVFADNLRTQVVDMKAKGAQAIGCENLIRYLTDFIADPQVDVQVPDDAALEHYKAQLQAWTDDRKSQHEQRLELFRSVIQAGRTPCARLS